LRARSFSVGPPPLGGPRGGISLTASPGACPCSGVTTHAPESFSAAAGDSRLRPQLFRSLVHVCLPPLQQRRDLRVQLRGARIGVRVRERLANLRLLPL